MGRLYPEDHTILIRRDTPLWEIHVVGDRWYMQQGAKKGDEKKPARKLKADWIKEVHSVLGEEVPGLDKCTIPTLEGLLNAINKSIKEALGGE